MRYDVIVIVSPLSDFVACNYQVQKPALVATAVPELAVEAFDKRILRRLARLNRGQHHFPLTRLEEHRLVGRSVPLSKTTEAGIMCGAMRSHLGTGPRAGRKWTCLTTDRLTDTKSIDQHWLELSSSGVGILGRNSRLRRRHSNLEAMLATAGKVRLRLITKPS